MEDVPTTDCVIYATPTVQPAPLPVTLPSNLPDGGNHSPTGNDWLQHATYSEQFQHVPLGHWEVVGNFWQWRPFMFPGDSWMQQQELHMHPYNVGGYFVPNKYHTNDLNVAFPPISQVATPSSASPVHPDLSVSPLHWSISDIPSTAKARVEDVSSDTWRNYGKWASSPACRDATAIVVRFDHINMGLEQWMKMWGPIRIQRPNPTTGDSATSIAGILTVEDVLQGIYAYFHSPLTSLEQQRLSVVDRNLLFATRFRRMGCDPMQCHGKEPLRVDVLNGFIGFAGLKFLAKRTDASGTVELALDLQMGPAWAQWSSDTC